MNTYELKRKHASDNESSVLEEGKLDIIKDAFYADVAYSRALGFHVVLDKRARRADVFSKERGAWLYSYYIEKAK